MKCSLAVGLALTVLTASAAWSEQAVTLIGDDNYYPYSYKEDGAAKGIYVDVLKAVDAKMDGYSFTFDMKPWKRGLKMVEKGQSLAIFPPYNRPKTRPYIAPVSESLLEESVVVVCDPKAISGKTLTKYPDDFAGLHFGNNAGFAAPGQAFFDMAKAGKLKVSEAASGALNLKKMLAGRIDCYINDRFIIESELKKLGSSLDKMAVPAVVSAETAHLGFSRDFKAPYRDDFIAKFDTTIKAMKASGELDTLIKESSAKY